MTAPLFTIPGVEAPRTIRVTMEDGNGPTVSYDRVLATLSPTHTVSDMGVDTTPLTPEMAVAWVSPDQFAAHADPSNSEDFGGVYLPVRKSKRGKFTTPLFSSPQRASLTADKPDTQGDRQ